MARIADNFGESPKFPRTHGSFAGYSNIQSEANSTGGRLFGLAVGVCAAVSVVMLTIKLGLVLFS